MCSISHSALDISLYQPFVKEFSICHCFRNLVVGHTCSCLYALTEAYSVELIPRNFRPYGWLCLSSDADAVESKLNELEATGDEEALARWKVERRKAVQDRDAVRFHGLRQLGYMD
jgi:hypothetical protein